MANRQRFPPRGVIAHLARGRIVSLFTGTTVALGAGREVTVMSKRILVAVVGMTILGGCGTGASRSAERTPDVPSVIGPAPQMVQVDVQAWNDAGAPAASAPVVIGDANGSAMSTRSTSSDGTVSAQVVPGGEVTLVSQQPGVTSVSTAVGLQAGSIDVAFGMPATTATGSVSVTLPGTVSGASFYELSYGCGDTWTGVGDATLSLDVDGACGAVVSVLAVARDGSWKPIAYADLDVASGASASFGGWRTDFQHVAAMFTDAPAQGGALSAAISAWHGGLRYDMDSAYVQVGGGAGAAFDLVLPGDGFAQQSSYHAEIDFADGSGSAIDRRVATAQSISEDLGADLLARPTSITVDTTDSARPALQWTTDATNVDAAEVFGGWTSQAGDTSMWQALVNGNPGRVQMAALPDSLGGARPDVTGAASLRVDLYHVSGGFQAIVGATGWTPTPGSSDYTLAHSWANQ